MGSKVNFKASDNLLKDVITRQAGSPLKGITELMQNSLDGIAVLKRTKPRHNGKIKITISSTGHQLIWEDNGIGLGRTKEEITNNFSVFGLGSKRDDKELLGEFGMGRGQTMSMIYNPETDKLDGDIKVFSGSYVLENFRVDKELSFEITKTQRTVGTRWVITGKNGFFTGLDIESYIRRNVRTDISVTINGSPVIGIEPVGKKYEKEKYTVWLDRKADGFNLFDRSIRVNTIEIFGGWGGTIVTKCAVKQNFARTDVIEGDSVLGEAINFVRQLILDEIRSLKANSRINDFQRRGMINFIYEQGNNSSAAAVWSHIKLFSATNGKKYSLDDMSSKEVYSGNKGDITADALMQRGAVVLENSYSRAIAAVRTYLHKRIDDYKQALPNSVAGRYLNTKAEKHHEQEMKYTEEQLNTAVVFNAAYNHGKREITFGKSDVSNGWTDGNTYVCMNWDYVKRNVSYYKKAGILSVLMSCHGLIAHEMAHDVNDTVTNEHGYGFEKAEITWRDKQITTLLNIGQDRLERFELDLGWVKGNGKKKVVPKEEKSDGIPEWFAKVMTEAGASVVYRSSKAVAKVIGSGSRNWVTMKKMYGCWMMQLDLEREDSSPISVDNPNAEQILRDYVQRTR